MLDIKLLREHPEEIELRLRSKEPDASVAMVLSLDTEIRELKQKVEKLKSDRRSRSKEIGEKKRSGEDVTSLMKEVAGAGDEIAAIDETIRQKSESFVYELSSLPNLPMRDIPVSLNPKDNVCIKTIGEKPTFAFPFKNHVELNEKLDMFDFVRGAKISGTGWPVYKNMGARLEWALLNYMIDTHIANGFTMWMPPHLVRPEIMHGVGQLPKFEKQLFKVTDEDYNLYLIPTAEAPLCGLHYDEILSDSELPKKYIAYTPCFRREAGAAGSHERGLIRVHQFNKVEMFAYAKPEESETIFDDMMKSAEEILGGLGLHYRNMLLVTGDMSFGSAKTIDIEVWLPGQDRYYEVSSVSHCTDYQSRRAKIRYRKAGDKPHLLHTLNGSGLATSRLMVALLENYQNEDGSIKVPPVLHKYLGGTTTISG